MINNITDFIDCKDMREYLKSQTLSIIEQCSIIVHSLKPLEDKINYLYKMIIKYPNENIINLLYNTYKLSYESLYNPDKNIIIFASIFNIDIKPVNTISMIDKNFSDDIIGAFNNIDEVFEECSSGNYYNNTVIELLIYDISEIGNLKPYFNYIGIINNNKLEIINYDNVIFDKSTDDTDRINIYNYFKDNSNIIMDDNLFYYYDSIKNGLERHPAFPYKNNELLKYDIPYLKEPIYGYMASEPDGNNTMYCFFQNKPGGIENCENFIDFSYSLVDFIVTIPYFEYLSRATKGEIKEYEEKINL